MNWRPIVSLLFAILLGACAAATNKSEKLLDQTLDAYAAAIRWGRMEDAIQFLDPVVTRPGRFELERLAQLQIAGYREQPPIMVSEGRVDQVVEIEFINRHTLVTRSSVERMSWRYDASADRWWLTSGLPKLASSP